MNSASKSGFGFGSDSIELMREIIRGTTGTNSDSCPDSDIELPTEIACLRSDMNFDSGLGCESNCNKLVRQISLLLSVTIFDVCRESESESESVSVSNSEDLYNERYHLKND